MPTARRVRRSSASSAATVASRLATRTSSDCCCGVATTGAIGGATAITGPIGIAAGATVIGAAAGIGMGEAGGIPTETVIPVGVGAMPAIGTGIGVGLGGMTPTVIPVTTARRHALLHDSGLSGRGGSGGVTNAFLTPRARVGHIKRILDHGPVGQVHASRVRNDGGADGIDRDLIAFDQLHHLVAVQGAALAQTDGLQNAFFFNWHRVAPLTHQFVEFHVLQRESDRHAQNVLVVLDVAHFDAFAFALFQFGN
jgi:hypothetical protein